MDPSGCTILILNYNGRTLLEENLPSIHEAASASRRPCAIAVVDNNSHDDSVAYLRRKWPEVAVFREPNRGLASFNRVATRLESRYLYLLNNDVRLDAGAIDPLLDALGRHQEAFFAAPLCWDATGQVYEGLRTRVRSVAGLIQGRCRVPDAAPWIHRRDLTAASGPALMVDRSRFLALGGYDPIYDPGRIEDLDLGFRAWMRGWTGHYIPESVAYHLGAGSFGPTFGDQGNQDLAWRNTFLFVWKNLAGRRLIGHCGWIVPRLLHALIRGQFGRLAAFGAALDRLGPALSRRKLQGVGTRLWQARQEAYFHRFLW